MMSNAGIVTPRSKLLVFVVSAVGGVAIGLAAGWVLVAWLRKLDDRPLSILLSAAQRECSSQNSIRWIGSRSIENDDQSQTA